MGRRGAAWDRCPGQPGSAIFPEAAARQGACHFLHQEQVRPEDILQPPREALAERCAQPAAGLLGQDTPSWNSTGWCQVAAGLGPWRERAGTARGLRGFAPGLEPGGACPQTRGIGGGDRASDLSEWFRRQAWPAGRAAGEAAPGADPSAAAVRLVAQSKRRWALEDRPWRDAGSLKKCLAFDAITA